MSMNIGAMFRAWFKDAAPTEGRALELRVGQIVRGVLMEMLDDGDALMNIGGVPVRAKLETNLQPGRGTLLQVMPGSNGGTVILKALGDPSVQMPEEGLKEALKSFGLPEQRWSFELLRGLRSDGYPLNKDTASYFQEASKLRPAAVDSASWMTAASVAFRRGLPPSSETITALRQALYGQPLTNELAGLIERLSQWMNTEGAKFPKAAELAGRLQALYAQGEELLNLGRQQLEKGSLQQPGSSALVQQEAVRQPAASSQTGIQPDGSQRPHLAALMTADAAKSISGQGLPRSDMGAAQQAANAPQAASTSSPPAPVRAQESVAVTSRISVNAGQDSANISVRPSSIPAESALQNLVRPETADMGIIANQSAAGKGEIPWIGRFLGLLGISHEHQLIQEWGDIRRTADPGNLHGESQPSAGERFAGENTRNTQDTLKSVLLAMTRMEDFPPQIREAAQTLVQHITGQQLLLASERQAGNPMSMMTFFVPIKSADGETTATIHVQTRRGRKGEWDADNCRLLFDLNMRYLGETIVDVQVVDRIVSVKLMNDFPAMTQMAEEAREQLEEGMRAAGFQLLSLTVQSFPEITDNSSAEGTETSEMNSAGAGVSAFSSKPYKGVDYRV